MGKKRRKSSSSSSNSQCSETKRLQPAWIAQAESSLDIPDHLGNDVTFDQKKRLARLAKMGLGPVAKPGKSQYEDDDPPESYSLEAAEDPAAWERERLYRLQERRAALIEHERRLRFQQERQEQEEANKSLEETEKRGKKRAGMTSLGPVQPRDDNPANAKTPATPPAALAGFFESTPARFAVAGHAPVLGAVGPGRFALTASEAIASQRSASQGAVGGFGRLAIKISTDTAQRVNAMPLPKNDELSGDDAKSKVAAPLAAKETSSELLEAPVLKSLRRAKKNAKKDRDSKKKNKKVLKPKNKRSTSSSSGRKKRRKKSSSSSSRSDQDGRSSDDDTLQQSIMQARHKGRDAGLPWKAMSGVESIRGRVTNDNKRLTDADLERRFASQASDIDAAGLMTEAQVLAMLQKEKVGKADGGSSARRAKRELEEWTNKKKQQLSRVGSFDKERLVVPRGK